MLERVLAKSLSLLTIKALQSTNLQITFLVWSPHDSPALLPNDISTQVQGLHLKCKKFGDTFKQEQGPKNVALSFLTLLSVGMLFSSVLRKKVIIQPHSWEACFRLSSYMM